MNIDLAALRALEREREIPFDTILAAIETALLTAYRHTEGAEPHARVEIDRKTGAADKPFTIAFVNEDPGTPHNVELQNGSGTVVFKGEVFNGVETKIYNVPAQPAGAYKFICAVHPTMTGTADLQ